MLQRLDALGGSYSILYMVRDTIDTAMANTTMKLWSGIQST